MSLMGNQSVDKDENQNIHENCRMDFWVYGFCFLRQGLALSPRLEYNGAITAPYSLDLLAQVILLPQSPE